MRAHPRPRRRAFQRSVRVTRIADAAALALASSTIAPAAIGAYFGDRKGRLRLSMSFDLDHVHELATWPLGLPDRSLSTALLVSNEPVGATPNEDRILRWFLTRANFAREGVELVDWMIVVADLLESMSIRSGVGRFGDDDWRWPASQRDAA
jgi:hypothetical protein